ncbi:hypothetical protein P280DRAFT_147682 [Massarina eburnea CBS 473.64]|uniref:Uncharacterized protein n=1 Tax=Massarina eburnea CBS 473.64 TaxID=1395130 RepID=A0A6A6RNE5_9PLEO|nr:hypothetical protein P280DRAFT_147682 [Massarina eburnea CBS 473.64]
MSYELAGLGAWSIQTISRARSCCSRPSLRMRMMTTELLHFLHGLLAATHSRWTVFHAENPACNDRGVGRRIAFTGLVHVSSPPRCSVEFRRKRSMNYLLLFSTVPARLTLVAELMYGPQALCLVQLSFAYFAHRQYFQWGSGCTAILDLFTPSLPTPFPTSSRRPCFKQ